jgi:glycosyltransferase involved in cell wall biosynthesis
MLSLSIIIPVYNAEKYLEQCLDSVINQTMQDFEIICIDDGSMDSSDTILNNYAIKDPRFVIIKQENQGAGAARNNGMVMAKGEYLAFMDSDDWYPSEDILQNLFSAAIDNNALICGGSLDIFIDDDLKIIRNEEQSFNASGFMNYAEYQYDYGYYRFIYKRAFLQENNITFPDYKRFEDPPFFVKAMCTAGKFYTSPQVTYRYRYGHQDYNWSEQQNLDALKGLTDNLILSAQYKLEKLHLRTVFRFEEPVYLEPTLKYLASGSRAILHALIIANSKVDENLLRINDESFGDNFLFTPLEVLLRDAIFTQQFDMLSYSLKRALTWGPIKIAAFFRVVREEGLRSALYRTKETLFNICVLKK